MMEIIDSLVEYDATYASIREQIPTEVSTDEAFEALQADTSKMEHVCLLVGKARQQWHGTAYGALTKDKHKTEYRETWGIENRIINIWTNRVSNYSNSEVFSEFLDRYPGSHLDAALALPEDEREEWLEKAKELKWTAKYFAEKIDRYINGEPLEETHRERIERLGGNLTKALDNCIAKTNTLANEVGARKRDLKLLMDMGLGDKFILAATELIAAAKRLSREHDSVTLLTIEDTTNE